MSKQPESHSSQQREFSDWQCHSRRCAYLIPNAVDYRHREVWSTDLVCEWAHYRPNPSSSNLALIMQCSEDFTHSQDQTHHARNDLCNEWTWSAWARWDECTIPHESNQCRMKQKQKNQSTTTHSTVSNLFMEITNAFMMDVLVLIKVNWIMWPTYHPPIKKCWAWNVMLCSKCFHT